MQWQVLQLLRRAWRVGFLWSVVSVVFELWCFVCACVCVCVCVCVCARACVCVCVLQKRLMLPCMFL